jgi:hypothetical protein
VGGRGEEDWSCSGGAPLVAMVQTSDLRNAHDASSFGRLHPWWFGCILVQSQVTTTVMITVEKRSEMARQAGLFKNDHVIQALPANGPNYPFDISPLPGRAWGRQHLLDSHGLHLLHKLVTKNPVPVAQ